jgi:hypothetical protein
MLKVAGVWPDLARPLPRKMPQEGKDTGRF